MALAILGRGSLQGLTVSGYALTPRFSPHVVRGCKLPRPKRARAILGSGGKAAVQNARVQQEQGSMLLKLYLLTITSVLIYSLSGSVGRAVEQ